MSSRCGSARDTTKRAEAQIDASWATGILAGTMSPLEALERRLAQRPPAVLGQVRDAINGRTLRRIDSRAADVLTANQVKRPESWPTRGEQNEAISAGTY